MKSAAFLRSNPRAIQCALLLVRGLRPLAVGALQDDNGMEGGTKREFWRVQRASSAVSLVRMGRDQELRRLQDDFRVLKEAARTLEGQLEVLRGSEAEARSSAAQARTDQEAQRQHVQRHLMQARLECCSYVQGVVYLPIAN